jgi:hypothetical protein
MRSNRIQLCILTVVATVASCGGSSGAPKPPFAHLLGGGKCEFVIQKSDKSIETIQATDCSAQTTLGITQLNAIAGQCGQVSCSSATTLCQFSSTDYQGCTIPLAERGNTGWSIWKE